ncbi:hypothetical protein [Culturomica massiliensis]|jgi:hypothetical protein|uniref:hypothetical protein n=1 Tax=Culturomica massiliensis TaxID=1841857 RepID=UPI000E558B81|nr:MULTISPECIES: hypothetical protein [Odoribacteraceae]RHV92954.1 hypothetical protein DXA95_11345 [Odoribacter sp. OF09-27XD]
MGKTIKGMGLGWILGGISVIEFVLWDLVRLRTDVNETTEWLTRAVSLTPIVAVIGLFTLLIYGWRVWMLARGRRISPEEKAVHIYIGILLHTLVYIWWGIGVFIPVEYIYINTEYWYIPQGLIVIGWVLQRISLKQAILSAKSQRMLRTGGGKLQGLTYLIAYLFVISLALSSVIFYMFSSIFEEEADVQISAMIRSAWLLTFFIANIVSFNLVIHNWKNILSVSRSPAKQTCPY